MLNEVAASHECAVKAVPRHVRRRWFKSHPFANAKDIDQADWLSDMTAAVPSLPEAVRVPVRVGHSLALGALTDLVRGYSCRHAYRFAPPGDGPAVE